MRDADDELEKSALETRGAEERALWAAHRFRRVGRALAAVAAVVGIVEFRGGHGFSPWLIPLLLAAGFLVLFGRRPRKLPSASASRANIGLGASIGRGAKVMPGATVEMGASIGAGAVIESGAVVRMGASVAAGAVIESGAVVSWGASVAKNARVGAKARVGAGASVGKGAHVPAGTWVMPGGDWKGGDARESEKESNGQRSLEAAPGAVARDLAASTSSAGESKAQLVKAPAAPPIDPRQARLDAVFARIDQELALSPAQVREHLGPSVSGVRGIKQTCKSLLERERNLRAEAAPEALAQLAAEKEALGKRIAGTDDDQVKLSLASAVAAIEEQIRQRQLLARSADRLDAELTRLFWTLDALAAQLVRMRSAGTEAMQAPDAAFEKSVQELQGEIDAIADALEQVAKDDRRPAAPVAAEHAVAPPSASGVQSGSADAKKIRG